MGKPWSINHRQADCTPLLARTSPTCIPAQRYHPLSGTNRHESPHPVPACRRQSAWLQHASARCESDQFQLARLQQDQQSPPKAAHSPPNTHAIRRNNLGRLQRGVAVQVSSTVLCFCLLHSSVWSRIHRAMLRAVSSGTSTGMEPLPASMIFLGRVPRPLWSWVNAFLFH